MSYDDDLTDWVTSSGKINDHEIVLVSHLTQQAEQDASLEVSKKQPEGRLHKVWSSRPLQANPYDKDYVRAGERIQELEEVFTQQEQIKAHSEIGIKTYRNTDLLHPALWCNDKIIQDAIELGKECWNRDRNGGYDGWKKINVEYKSSKYSSYYRRSWYVNFNLFDDSGMPIIAKEAKSFKLVVVLGIRRAELTWDLTALSK